MNNVRTIHAHESFSPEEAPTRPDITSTKILAAASKIDRLSEIAIERLQFSPDPHTIVEAMADLAQIREIARGLR